MVKFAIEGAKRFLNNGKIFSYRDKLDEERQSYKHSANSFAEFASIYIKYDESVEPLLFKEIYHCYKKYCSDNCTAPLSNVKCVNHLKANYDTESVRVGKKSDSAYARLRLTYPKG